MYHKQRIVNKADKQSPEPGLIPGPDLDLGPVAEVW
jgi:hypothetical protein